MRHPAGADIYSARGMPFVFRPYAAGTFNSTESLRVSPSTEGVDVDVFETSIGKDLTSMSEVTPLHTSWGAEHTIPGVIPNGTK
jgi:hypothetical protein